MTERELFLALDRRDPNLAGGGKPVWVVSYNGGDWEVLQRSASVHDGTAPSPRTPPTAAPRSSSSCRSGSAAPDRRAGPRAPPGAPGDRLLERRRPGGRRSCPSSRARVRERGSGAGPRRRVDARELLHLAHVGRHLLAADGESAAGRQRPRHHPGRHLQRALRGSSCFRDKVQCSFGTIALTPRVRVSPARLETCSAITSGGRGPCSSITFAMS